MSIAYNIITIKKQKLIFLLSKKQKGLEMSTYAQVTIHSQKSKQHYLNKMHRINKYQGKKNRGKLIKGWRLSITNTANKNLSNKQDRSSIQKYHQQIQNNCLRVQNLKKQKLNMKEQVQIKKQISSSKQIYDQIINSGRCSNKNNIINSQLYPSIFYKKTTMRAVLKQFRFPNHCKALPPNDQRLPLIHQVIANLFNQITISVFNILIAQDNQSNSYFIFFSDSQITPYTKCCNCIVYVQIKNNSNGYIKCNGKNCKHIILAQFAVDYEDGKKIWKNLTFITSIPSKDLMMKQKIAKYIKTGRFKCVKLKTIIKQTSKLVQQQFYQNKKFIQTQNSQQFNDAFITNGSNQPVTPETKVKAMLNQEEIVQFTSTDDKNVQSLKMKLTYVSKRHGGIQDRLAKSIIDDGKIFNKQFEMNQKIDEIMRKTKNSANSTFYNFPRLMDQMRDQQQRKSKSFYKKQNNDSFMKN